MKFPNAYFGNGPSNGEDLAGQRDQEAYQRNRLQMTVATSSFAGVALVGMFCSCLWFICCRNSSSKTRKKARTTWASAEAGLQNPYSYDGYLESQNNYMQMTGNTDTGVAPYLNNPLYHPTSLDAESSLPNPYDFSDHNFGMNHHPLNGVPNKAQLSQLFCGTSSDLNSSTKDVPPSYTALFFATSDAGKEGDTKVNPASSSETKITNIQPIHLRVTSSAEKERMEKKAKEAAENGGGDDDMNDFYGDDYLNCRPDPSTAPPVSLLSVESDPGNNEGEGEQKGTKSPEDKHSSEQSEEKDKRVENPPPYNPGYEAYRRF